MKKVIILSLAVSIFASCSSTGNMGIATKSQANPSSLLTSSQSFKEIGPVKGKACRYFILGIIPTGDSTVTQAIDNALSERGDALLNISVTSSLYGFLPIYNIFSYTCTEVEGIAIEFETQ